jgi:hypothetical protein
MPRQPQFQGGKEVTIDLNQRNEVRLKTLGQNSL